MPRYLTILFLGFMIFSVQPVLGQANPIPDVTYRIWVKTMDDTPKLKGELIDVLNDALLVSRVGQHNTEEIGVENIQRLYFRRKAAVPRGMLFGTLIGSGAAAIITLEIIRRPADCPNCYSEEDATIASLAAVAGGYFGFFIGLVAGTNRHLIKIGGSQLELEANRGLLLRYRF